MGTFFFDLPNAMERKDIWAIYEEKYDIKDNDTEENVDDEGWTGAEIKQCCKLASKLNMSLKEAANFIVPVCKSAAEQIEALRRLASGKFINANEKGIYSMNTVTVQKSGRKFE